MRSSYRRDFIKPADLILSIAHENIKLTVVAAVSGQPLPFGTVRCPDDADQVAALDGQIVLTSLRRHGYFCLVHGLLLSCDLTITQHTPRTHSLLVLEKVDR